MHDRLPDRKTVTLAMQQLAEALQFRDNNGFTKLFNDTAAEDVQKIAEELAAITSDEEDFGGCLQDLREKVLDFVGGTNPMRVVKDSEQSLRDIRDVTITLKREVPNFEDKNVYRDLARVEKWLKKREEALYTYLESDDS